VKLAPQQPPGRITRKARTFEAEIVQLRAQGYTLEANRRAASNPIAAAGASAPGALPSSPRGSTTDEAPAAVASPAAPPERPSGKEIAEAFVRTKSANPLIRAKEHP
jgi:hypothetical protein